MFASLSMNHRSMPLRSASESGSIPFRNAFSNANSRRSFGASIVSGPSSQAAGGFCSRERMALTSAASNVRSSAITSPVDAICVPRRLSPAGNLSNGQRGILTTQ